MALLANSNIQIPSQAQLGLETKLDIQAELSSGSEGSGILHSRLGSHWSIYQVLAGLELNQTFLGLIHPAENIHVSD